VLVEAAERAQPAGTEGTGVGPPPVRVRARRGRVGDGGPRPGDAVAAAGLDHLGGGGVAVGGGVEVLERKGVSVSFRGELSGWGVLTCLMLLLSTKVRSQTVQHR
jgi:hypothetical protein